MYLIVILSQELRTDNYTTLLRFLYTRFDKVYVTKQCNDCIKIMAISTVPPSGIVVSSKDKKKNFK